MWLIIDIVAFLVVVALTGFIIPQILLIAFRKNLFDEIDPRKIHKGAVPRLGGIAFFPGITFAVLLAMGVVLHIGAPSTLRPIADTLPTLCLIGCSVILLYLIGMADDLIGVKYRAKFVAQIISAALIIAGGLQLDDLHGFLWLHHLPLGVSIPLTLLLTVFITNAINLIDGIDGLASGLSAIACLFYGLICLAAGEQIYALIAFTTLGTLLPFFYYNVFGNASKHSKIFMGDTGSLTIGLILSILAVKICSLPDLGDSQFTIHNSQLFRIDGVNFGVIAFAPLLIPCCDVVRVYLHRIRQGRSPFLPDRTHIHHKLLALGMSQRVAMPAIVGASVVLTVGNYLLSGVMNITLLFGCDLVVWLLANTLLCRLIRRRQRKTGIILYK